MQTQQHRVRLFREHSAFAVASNDQDRYCQGQASTAALLMHPADFSGMLVRSGCLSATRFLPPGCFSGTLLTLRHVLGLLGKGPSYFSFLFYVSPSRSAHPPPPLLPPQHPKENPSSRACLRQAAAATRDVT